MKQLEIRERYMQKQYNNKRLTNNEKVDTAEFNILKDEVKYAIQQIKGWRVVGLLAQAH